MRFTPFMLRGRPDQTVRELNKMQDQLATLGNSIKVMSSDAKSVIIVGEGQPTDPSTGKPYPFGIYKYSIKGDRLEMEKDYGL